MIGEFMTYLVHHGIKGQKWGVRRTPEELGHVTSKELQKKGYPEPVTVRYPNGETCTMYTLTNVGTKVVNDLYDLYEDMRYIGYDATVHKLKTPEETASSRHGNCHDQVLYELKELRKKGYNPKARFVMDYDPETNEGGITHSFVYLQKDGLTMWLEHAWGDHTGVFGFASKKDLETYIEHKIPRYKKTNELIWGDFDDTRIKPGQSLQQIVDNVIWDEE